MPEQYTSPIQQAEQFDARIMDIFRSAREAQSQEIIDAAILAHESDRPAEQAASYEGLLAADVLVLGGLMLHAAAVHHEKAVKQRAQQLPTRLQRLFVAHTGLYRRQSAFSTPLLYPIHETVDGIELTQGWSIELDGKAYPPPTRTKLRVWQVAQTDDASEAARHPLAEITAYPSGKAGPYATVRPIDSEVILAEEVTPEDDRFLFCIGLVKEAIRATAVSEPPRSWPARVLGRLTWY